MSAPYSGIIRSLLPIGVFALSACATDAASRAEVNDLTASIRAMRAENTRLESRVDKLEKQLTVRSIASTGAGAVAESNEMPALTVVKLKPRKEAAPRLNTHVAVVEPSEDEAITVNDSNAGSFNAGDSDTVAFGDAAYEKALTGLKTGNTEGSVGQLKTFASENPKHPKADNALYFAGVGEMGLRDYDTALKTFETLTTRYPASDTALDAQLKAAECKTRLNRTEEAKAAYQHIISTSPGTTAASVAQSRLANWSSASAATR